MAIPGGHIVRHHGLQTTLRHILDKNASLPANRHLQIREVGWLKGESTRRYLLTSAALPRDRRSPLASLCSRVLGIYGTIATIEKALRFSRRHYVG